MAWARSNTDKVHVMVFIAFRAAIQEQFAYFAGEERVEVKGLTYTRAAPQRTDIDGREIVDVLRARFPEFEPAAYLNGTEGARLLQMAHDPARGGQGPLLRQRRTEVRRALPGLEPPGEGAVPGLRAPLDARQRPEACSRSPPSTPASGRPPPPGRGPWSATRCGRRAPCTSSRSSIIQPVDVLPDGRQSMCDSCPDMTVHEGQLVWSCQLEERLKYGELMRLRPETARKQTEDAPT